MLPLIGSVAAPIVGGLLGKLFGRGKQKKADAAQAAALAEIEKIGAPPDLAKQIMLEKFKSAGLYSPKLEDAIDQTVSQVSQIQEDPALKEAQMGALQSLQQQGRTGLSATDRAALNKVRGEAARDTEAKRQQIIQNMQARGQAGGGAELAAQLQAAQGGSDQASEAGDRIAAMAQERALNAIGQAGQLGGQVRAQDFDVNRLRAAARDEMDRFNIQNAVNRQQRNVGSQNEAQAANLANQQAIMNANAQQANAERLRQAEAARQNWADRTQQAGMLANARLGQASQLQQQAQNTAQGFQNVGSGAGAAFGALAGRLNKTPAAPGSPVPASTDGSYQYGDEDELNKKIANTNTNRVIS